jgi:hypothetical protein
MNPEQVLSAYGKIMMYLIFDTSIPTYNDSCKTETNNKLNMKDTIWNIW